MSSDIARIVLPTLIGVGGTFTNTQYNSLRSDVDDLLAGITSGTGSPENVVTASPGTLYLRTDDVDPADPLYVKNTGAGNDGWLPIDGHARQHWEAGYRADLAATTFTSKGIGAVTVTGTPSSAHSSSGSYVDITTTAVLNNAAKVVTPSILRADWGVDAEFHIRPRAAGDLTSVRIWACLAASDPSGSSTPLIEHAGFRFDDGLDVSTWRCHVSDGTTTGTVDSFVTVSANTSKWLRIVLTDTTARFYINNTFVGERTANLPAASTLLAAYVTITTLSAAVKNLSVGYANFLIQ